MGSYVSGISGIANAGAAMANTAFSAMGIENPVAKVAVAGTALIAGSLASRAVVGTGSVVTKASGEITEAVGDMLKGFGQGVRSVGDALGNFATKSFNTELAIAAGTAVSTAAVYGITFLNENPEITKMITSPETYTNLAIDALKAIKPYAPVVFGLSLLTSFCSAASIGARKTNSNEFLLSDEEAETAAVISMASLGVALVSMAVAAAKN
jgi:hypothetical protein